MRIFTVYEASDGARFDDESACAAHEETILRVNEIMSRIGDRPNDDGCRFSNGRGYRQHSKDDVLFVQRELVKLANINGFDSHVEYTMSAKVPTGHTFMGRLMSEMASKPIANAYNRICCIDSQFREWGQPYFALNPDKAEYKEAV